MTLFNFIFVEIKCLVKLFFKPFLKRCITLWQAPFTKYLGFIIIFGSRHQYRRILHLFRLVHQFFISWYLFIHSKHNFVCIRNSVSGRTDFRKTLVIGLVVRYSIIMAHILSRCVGRHYPRRQLCSVTAQSLSIN